MQRFKAEPTVARQKRLEPTTHWGFKHHWDATCTALLLLFFSVEMRYVPGSLLKPKQRNSSNSLCSKTLEKSRIIIKINLFL